MPEPVVDVAPEDGAVPVRLPLVAVTLPSRFRGTVDDGRLPYRVELTLSFDGRRVACEELICRRREDEMPITSEGMTKIRVAELVHLVASDPRVLREQAAFVAPGRPAISVQSAFEVPPPPQGRAGPSVEHLRALAVLYTVAYASGGNPRQTVMDQMGLARTTANRWIRAAREAGYLAAGRGDDDEGTD